MALPEKIITKDKKVSVNICCQRCCQPLKFAKSFKDLNYQALSELSMPLYSSSKREDPQGLIAAFQERSDKSSVMRKIVLPVKLNEVSSDFMFVDELSNLPFDSNQIARITSTVYDVMSDQSDVDYPVCEECTDIVQDQMDFTLKTVENECKEYRDFLGHLDKGNEEDELEKLKLELAAFEREESDLEAQLSLLETKEKEIKVALKVCEEEWESLRKEEDKRWQECCRVQRQLLLSKDNHCSVDNQLKYAQSQLDKLSKINVFNATFHIWHSGHFGTINNFRLGRLRTVPVEWPEINAAWGQTVLLLHSLAKKINFTFERYRLVPYGNHSHIETLEKLSKDLPLYCFGGKGFMLDHKFDLAMVAFLDCLQQFKEKVESGDTSFHLPYTMDKGKIIDKSSNNTYSIKVQFNSEEQWTKALKFMLTNLKWALAWVSTQFQDNNQSRF